MISGRMAFSGATISDTLAAVLERSPDWTALPPATPPPLRHLLARCLEKDPKHRWKDIGNVRIGLDDAEAGRPPTDGASPKTSRAAERLAWALLVALTAAVAAVATPWFRQAPASEIRFTLGFPRDVAANFAQLAISPDGQQIVVAPGVGGQQRTPLWLRPLASTSGRLLTSPEGATLPFWSPDGQSIGFFADQKLKRLDVNSEAIQDVADAPNARGGAWQADGTILFAPNAAGPLFRVAPGGQPTAASQLEPGQRDHRAPLILRTGNTSSITRERERDRRKSAGTRGSPRWDRGEAAARRGRCSRLYAVRASAVSAAGRAVRAGVRCDAAAARG